MSLKLIESVEQLNELQLYYLLPREYNKGGVNLVITWNLSAIPLGTDTIVQRVVNAM